MAAIRRHAEIEWSGTLANGQGNLTSQSGSLDDAVMTLPTRLGSPEGKTSPEELLASAHAGCFCMSIVGALNSAGTPADRTTIACEVTMDMVDGKGFRIVSSQLTVRVSASGLDEAGLGSAVATAHQGCGFSWLLRDSGALVEIDHALES